jgi:uncharacterized membrane protein
MMADSAARNDVPWLDRTVIGALYLFTAASVIGYATFGLNPQLLASTPGAITVYTHAFTVFPRGHIILGFIALAIPLFRYAGWRWIASLVALYALSLASELSGTTSGLPFGPYRYTNGLGTKLFDHVPVLIPLSWFTMAVPSFALAMAWLRGGTPLGRIAIGSMILLAWDLVLDPAMSGLTPYWIWGSTGPYYGMPWLNLFGWYVTGIVLMGALELLRADRWVRKVPLSISTLVYGANLLLPLAMCVAGGYVGAAVASVVTIAACYWVATLIRQRSGAASGTAHAGAA